MDFFIAFAACSPSSTGMQHCGSIQSHHTTPNSTRELTWRMSSNALAAGLLNAETFPPNCHENAAWFSLNFLFIQVSLHSLTYREVIANLLNSLPRFPLKRITPSIGSEQEIDSQRYNYTKSRSQELYCQGHSTPTLSACYDLF